MTVPILNLEPYRGDVFTRTLKFETAAGVAINVTGLGFLAQIRSQPDSEVVLATFGIDTTDEATGIIIISLTEEDTELVALRQNNVWDLQACTPAVKTYVRGSIVVIADVTRVVSGS